MAAGGVLGRGRLRFSLSGLPEDASAPVLRNLSCAFPLQLTNVFCFEAQGSDILPLLLPGLFLLGLWLPGAGRAVVAHTLAEGQQ